VWDLTRREVQWDLEGHWGPVTALAPGFGEANESVVVSTSVDGTIRLWDPDTGVQTGGTFDPGVVVDQHAAVLSDGPALHDSLGFASHVSALGRLVTAVTTIPPLAIALLAPWGGGKSSFMRQLAATVSSLSGSSPQFVRAARVVQFNAWHYSDTSVLVGLITQVFRQLRTPQAAESPSARNTKEAETEAESHSTLQAQIEAAQDTVMRRRHTAEQVGAVDAGRAEPRLSTLRVFHTVVRYVHALRQFWSIVWSNGNRTTVALAYLLAFLLLEVTVAILLPIVAPEAAAWLAGVSATIGATLISAGIVVWRHLRALANLGTAVDWNGMVPRMVQDCRGICPAGRAGTAQACRGGPFRAQGSRCSVRAR
jgi:WD40 repeat protein